MEGAAARLLARREANATELTGFAIGAAGVLGGAGMALALAIGLPLRDQLLAGAPTVDVVLAAMTIPPTFVGAMVTAIVLRRGMLRLYASSQVVLAGFQVVLLAGCALTSILTPATALVVNLAASIVSTTILSGALARDLGLAALRPRLPRALARKMLRIGAALQGSSLALHLNMRADLLMVGLLTTSAEAGVYSLAVTLAEIALVAAATLGLAGLQDQADLSEADAFEFTREFTRQSLSLAIVLAAAALVGSYPFIAVFYGSAWMDSIVPCMILSLSVVALALETPIRNLLMRIYEPWKISVGSTAAMIVNIGLNAVLIPSIGIIGAAVASAISYGLAAIIMVGMLGRAVDRPVFSEFLRPPRSSDFRQMFSNLTKTT